MQGATQGPFLQFVVLALLMKVAVLDVAADPLLDSEATAPVPSLMTQDSPFKSGRRRWSSARLSPDNAGQKVHGAQASTTRKKAHAMVSLSSLPAVTLQDTISHIQHSREGGASVHPVETSSRLRAAQHEFPLSQTGVRTISPDIALKASSGRLLGISQAASGYVLALGFGNNALVSADADLGGYFYEHASGMEEITVNDANSYPRAVASDDMACFSMPGKLDCLVMDPNARREQRAWWDLPASQRGTKPTSPVWSKVIPPQVPTTATTCPWTWQRGSEQICVGEAASAWQKATAVMATSSTGVRYVSTHYAEQKVGGYDWVCTSGCDRDFGSALSWEKANMTSADPNYGKALALHGKFIAVGTPGEAGKEGMVEVFFARGEPGASGYGAHTSWEKVLHLPPPIPIGTNYIEYVGEGDFGAALSLSTKWLVIGAPGNSSVAALIRIYRVETLSHFCEVKHPNAAANSLFGASISQDTHEAYGWTTILVGAPGENLAYSILVRDNPPLCRMHEIFNPQANDKDITDGFGFSVTISSDYAFIGTPFYSRWYKDISGLLYASAFCFPGSTRPSQLAFANDLPKCTLCPKDQTSDGGSSDQCTACAVDIPDHASLNYGCSYTCDVGFFGAQCVTCPEYAISQNINKPEFSEWPDGQAGLNWIYHGTAQPTNGRQLENDKLAQAITEAADGPVVLTQRAWSTFGITDLREDDFIRADGKFWKPAQLSCAARCIGGYYATRTGNSTLTCSVCPSKSVFDALFNVQWILGTCEYECAYGYFTDPSDNLCYSCKELKSRQGIAPPANAEFVNGLSVCKWAPKVGFNCTVDLISNPNGECRGCENKPLQANFVDSDDQLSRMKCDFACKPNYHGHPDYSGVCVKCGILQENFASVALPLHALWIDNPSTCSADAWRCNNGYTRANSTRYCCPNDIPNSHPDPSYQPCGRACNPGYFWNMGTATCETCTEVKQNHNWLLDCDYECKCGPYKSEEEGVCYYGRHNSILDNCYRCDDYHDRLGTLLPPNGIWYANPPNLTIGGVTKRRECDEDAYYCSAGFTKSVRADPAGCCPDTLPYSSVTKIHAVGQANGAHLDTCGYECSENYMWHKKKKNCTFVESSKIANSKWDYRKGVWACLPSFKELDFVTVAHGEVQASQCMECSVYAIRSGWTLPERGSWLNASGLDGKPCNKIAFECSGGFVQNPTARLCCPPDPLPVSVIGGTHENGVWDRFSCTYRCGYDDDNRKLFPIVPTRGNSVCKTCPDYLASKGVAAECQEEGRGLDDSPLCQGILQDQSPSSCTASIRLDLFIEGISLNNFTAGPAKSVVLSALANLAAHPLDMTGLSYVKEDELGNIGARRRLLATGLLIGVLLRNLDPIVTIARKQTLQTSAQKRVSDALERAGYSTTVRMIGSPKDGPSSEAWYCGEGFTKNDVTGRCCYTQAYQDPSDINPSRYFWLDNGCQWQCVAGFKGPDCLSCTEYNRDKFKPENSVWDDNSRNCDTWKCRTGYIQSKSGFACNSLKQLEGICSSSTRCATCVAQGSCVWCGGSCVPGQIDSDKPDSNNGCPFINEVMSPDCTCEANTCSQECLYDTCSECVKDAYCGWCASSEKCMLGSYFSPQSGVCTSGWSAGTYTQCYTEQGIWMVGLIAASVSTLLVLLMCMHFILRLRAAQHALQRPPIVQFGAAPAGASSADQAREIMARFLETFPTFKYDSAKGKELGGQGPTADGTEGQQPAGNEGEELDPGDDEPVCSICLGNFVDGEECRMLPCLHVFHKACIDHWFSVSQECPLCKRSVMRSSTGQANSNFAAEQSRFGVPAGSESVDIAV